MNRDRAAAPPRGLTDHVRPRSEDIASSAIQIVAAVLSIVGLVILILLAPEPSGARVYLSIAIYGTTLVLAFVSAALFHATRAGRAKAILQTLDHCAIFLLIAGTYTPFALMALHDHLGWLLLALVWTLAAVGVAIRLLWLRRLYRLAPLLYLVIGWGGLVWSVALLDTIGIGGLALIVGGGIAYTTGILFFRWHRLRYSNAVWHLFVVAGAASHFCAVAFYVFPFYGAQLVS